MKEKQEESGRLNRLHDGLDQMKNNVLATNKDTAVWSANIGYANIEGWRGAQI